MASRSTEISKEYYDLEWSIPCGKLGHQTGYTARGIITRPPFQFCNGNWILKITSYYKSIYFHLCKEIFTGKPLFPSVVTNHNHKNFISSKSFLVKQCGMELELPLTEYHVSSEEMNCSGPGHDGITRYKYMLFINFPWVFMHETNSLKIVCRFSCVDCSVKLADVPALSDHELETLGKRQPKEEVFEFVGSEIRMHCPSDVLAGLKRRYPVEEVTEFNCSKVKRLCSSGLLLNDTMKDLINSGTGSDVRIKVKSREFRVHKCILRARSPVFFKMFNNNLYKKKNEVIEITDCEPDAFHEYLNYLYAEKLDDIPMNIACSLYYIGNKYKVEEIKRICVTSMLKHLSVETFYEFFTFAQLYKESTLLEAASEFFLKNIKALGTIQWLTFLKKDPVAANELLVKVTDH